MGPNSNIGNVGSGLATSSDKGDRDAWLLDSGASDHMTFGETDFITRSPRDAPVLQMLMRLSLRLPGPAPCPCLRLYNYHIHYLSPRSHINYYPLAKLLKN